MAFLFQPVAHTERDARAVLAGKQELFLEAAVTAFGFVVQVDALEEDGQLWQDVVVNT